MRKIKNQVTVSLAGVTVREQEALQCLLDLPIDRWDKDSIIFLFLFKYQDAIAFVIIKTPPPASLTARQTRPMIESSPSFAPRYLDRTMLH